MLKFLLDTDIAIYVIKHKPPEVRERFRRHHGRMAISTVTLMELVFGAENSARIEHNLEVIEGFVARLDVLDYDAQAAWHTGQIRAELRRHGRPIGPYDQMIAGHARARGLAVVTNNHAEFERVSGLRVVNWRRQEPSNG